MRLLILGGGGHASVVAETVRDAGRHDLFGFLDDDPTRQIVGLTNLGPIANAWNQHCAAKGFVLGIGSAELRRRWLEQTTAFGLLAPPIVHRRAWVSPSATLNPGVVIMAGAIVQAGSIIGVGTILNTGCSIDHGCRVGAWVHVAPGARLAGEVEIGDAATIGMMACIIEGRHVGARALVAAGAVVVRNVPPDSRVAGVPAHPMRTPV